jgi:hypothetical protein
MVRVLQRVGVDFCDGFLLALCVLGGGFCFAPHKIKKLYHRGHPFDFLAALSRSGQAGAWRKATED